MRRHKAFSLIELLIVVAVIGLLISLLVSTMIGIERAGRLAACRRNLHSIHTLFMAYADSNEGRLPLFHEYYGAMIFHPASQYVPYGVTTVSYTHLTLPTN